MTHLCRSPGCARTDTTRYQNYWASEHTPERTHERYGSAWKGPTALPLVKRGAERDRHVQVALVHATLAVVAGVFGEWQTVADRENHKEPPDPDQP